MIESYENFFLKRIYRYIRNNAEEVESYPTTIRDWIWDIFEASRLGLLDLRVSCENPNTEPTTICESANIVSDMIYQYHEDEDFLNCPIFRKLIEFSNARDLYWMERTCVLEYS